MQALQEIVTWQNMLTTVPAFHWKRNITKTVEQNLNEKFQRYVKEMYPKPQVQPED